MPNYTKRLSALRKVMRAEDLDLVLVTFGPYLRYLCGYTGSNGLLLVGHRGADFLTDFRYTTQVKTEVRGAKISISSGDLTEYLPELDVLKKGRKKVGIEDDCISMAKGLRLRHLLPNALFVRLPELVGPLMMVKDSSEIALIQRAAKIADVGFDTALEVIKPGVRERDVAVEMEYAMAKAGSEEKAFDTIVASGARAALPHGRASMKRIAKGDFVTLDFGATVDGYVSDITRTVVVGKPTSRQKRIYDLVRRAQATAVRKARSGMPCAKLDNVARSIIKRAGHGKRFGHGLGHGIGLQVHEGPALNAKSRTVLKTGMVVTVEPGVYLPGWGGVRIEDDIVIRGSGCRVLTKSERDLIVL
jgi:Xaa-Pro aminopeptidase